MQKHPYTSFENALQTIFNKMKEQQTSLQQLDKSLKDALNEKANQPQSSVSPQNSPSKKQIPEIEKFKVTLQLTDFDIPKRPFGSGAYGTTFKATWKKLKTQVCVKVSPPMSDPETFDSFMKEISIMSQISHQNIIQYYGHFYQDFQLYIVMEFADGGDLHDYMDEKSNTLSEKEIISIFFQITKAIQYLHSMKIIHLDLKPDNILLCDHKLWKLADFGASRTLQKSFQKKS